MGLFCYPHSEPHSLHSSSTTTFSQRPPYSQPRTESAPMLYICALTGDGNKQPSINITCNNGSHHRDDDANCGARILAMGASAAVGGSGIAASDTACKAKDTAVRGIPPCLLLLLHDCVVVVGGQACGGSCGGAGRSSAKGKGCMGPAIGGSRPGGTAASRGRFRPIQGQLLWSCVRV